MTCLDCCNSMNYLVCVGCGRSPPPQCRPAGQHKDTRTRKSCLVIWQYRIPRVMHSSGDHTQYLLSKHYIVVARIILREINRGVYCHHWYLSTTVDVRDFHCTLTFSLSYHYTQGCIELLDRSGVKIEGKEAVVLGRSNIVGKGRTEQRAGIRLSLLSIIILSVPFLNNLSYWELALSTV